MQKTTVVSAPGKVLLTGGYLVLDPAFTGLVVATEARFYTVIKATEDPKLQNTITVRSPQFLNAAWIYHATLSGEVIEISQSNIDENGKNSFVELAVAYAMAIIGRRQTPSKVESLLATGLDIVIAGNNDFYSQRNELANLSLPLTTESLKSIPLFASTHTTLSKVNKTGLGSSAALITSLVTAFLQHFNIVNLGQDGSNPQEIAFLHNAAQFVHCLAQGKVGSGFDVSSAVFGSHKYRRFSPELLSKVMHHEAIQDVPELLKIFDAEWDNKVTPLHLASGLHLMLADIDAGSHTPTLVSKVLKWRQSKPEEANGLWQRLGAANDRVVDLLTELDEAEKEDSESYKVAIHKAGGQVSSEWVGEGDRTSELLIKIRDEFLTVRKYLREMSSLADVPIEPQEQTRLLDACQQVPGVLMAGVPGAGGFDAIFCIVLSDKARQGVERVWSEFSEMSVGPLLCTQSTAGGLVLEYASGQGEKDVTISPADGSKEQAITERLLSL